MPQKPFNSFQAFALEQLQRPQSTTAKRMFGGVGVYHQGIFFARVDDGALWLKVNETNRADFEARGMQPFHPFGDDGQIMHYWQLPEDGLEDIDELRRWCDKAIAVGSSANRGTAKKSRSRRA